MWNKNDLKQFQIHGGNLQAIMGGFGSFTLIASKFLLEEGMGTPDESQIVQFEKDKWYPLDKFLRVCDRINSEFGSYTLRQAGIHVPKVAVFAPNIRDVTTAIQALDVGYHLNHALNGKPMFNLTTGEMTDGIGHYRYVPGPTPQKISCEVDSPYPCPFDEGLVTALSQRFMASATVTHDKAKCRNRGDGSCTYHISWK